MIDLLKFQKISKRKFKFLSIPINPFHSSHITRLQLQYSIAEKEKWGLELKGRKKEILLKYRKVDDEIEDRDKNLSKSPLIQNICKNCRYESLSLGQTHFS